jgi:hypothetical protein
LPHEANVIGQESAAGSCVLLAKEKKIQYNDKGFGCASTAFSATQGGVQTWQGSFKEFAFSEMTVA